MVLMINDFLAKLDNTPSAPGDVYWPTFTASTPSAAVSQLRNTFIGTNLQRRHKFLRCIQLLWAVEESSLIGRITANDSRVTYDRASLQAIAKIRGTNVVTVSGTGAANLQLFGNVEYAELTVTVAGTTIILADPTGASTTGTLAWAGGMSNTVTAPNGATGVFITGGPVTAGSWRIVRYAPAKPWIQTCLTYVNAPYVRQALPADLAAHYDAAPLLLEKLAAVICAMV